MYIYIYTRTYSEDLDRYVHMYMYDQLRAILLPFIAQV